MKIKLQGAIHTKPEAQKRKMKISFTAKSYIQMVTSMEALSRKKECS